MIIFAYMIVIQFHNICSTALMCGMFFLFIQCRKDSWRERIKKISFSKLIGILLCSELMIAPCSIFVLHLLFLWFHLSYHSIHELILLLFILLPVCAKGYAVYKIKKGQNP